MAETAQVVARYMVSPQQAAEMLHVSRATVLRMIAAGKLQASRISRKTLRIRMADVEALVEANKV